MTTAATPRGSILGTRVNRVEDPEFLTTGAVYTEDLVDERLEGAVRVTFVRAPIAHARITSIDTTAATAAEGCLAVITAKDLSDLPPAPTLLPMFPAEMAQPMLAGDVVRFVGEPVACVVHEGRYTGEDIAELVEVSYEPLPAVVHPKDALEGRTLLFPDLGTNVVISKDPEDQADTFDDCEVVVTQEVLNQRVAVAPLEVRSAAAVWADGRLTTWIPNQGAQGTQEAVVERLGLTTEQVRVITPAVGGAFGAKFGADPEPVLVCWVARHLGRPATWVETRSENMVGMTHGRAQIQTVTIGGDRDGNVKAYRLHVLQDSGAYPRFGAVLPTLTLLMAPAVYDIDRVESSFVSVATNTTPLGAYRGAGRPEATAVIERAMDLFAAAIEMDPAEVRRRNLLPAFTEPLSTKGGALYDCGNYPMALDTVLAAADYDGLRREQAARRERGDTKQLGIGLSVYVEITGGGDESGPPNENATVEVHPDGTATILTGTSPHGQGHATVWAMLASEELGIPVEKITVKWGDTDLVPQGGGTGGSRSLQQGGAAVKQAALELIDLARIRVADELEVAPEDLVVDLDLAGLAVRGDPTAAVSFAALAEKEPLLVRTVFSAPGATYPFGAHVAVAEVDVETGKAVLTRLIALDDAGTLVNPLIAEGQRHGGLAQGAAQALLEEVLYDEDGNPTTTTFADYPIVSATELPSFELVTTETPTTYNPLGAKGIGEAGTIGATPAVQNAVIDAVAHLGVRHIDMPTTSMRVWSAINAAKDA
jgi:aerobic carbon-monoxide dehydrogenase large subunit